MTSKLFQLNQKIIKCKKCKRLVLFRTKIAREKRKQFINETYWGKPITGYGDPKAQLLMIGLAPAAHGGNRTGRVFTGDKSADFLFKCLHAAKISNDNDLDTDSLANTYTQIPAQFHETLVYKVIALQASM